MSKAFYPTIEENYKKNPPRAYHDDLNYFLSEMLVDEGDGPKPRYPDDRLANYQGMLYDMVILDGKFFTNGPKRTGNFDTDFNNAVKYLQKLEKLAYQYNRIFEEGELEYGAGKNYEERERRRPKKANYSNKGEIEYYKDSLKKENIVTYNASFTDTEKEASDSLTTIKNLLGDKDISSLSSAEKKALKGVNLENGINKAFNELKEEKINGINKENLKTSLGGLRGNALDKDSMLEVIKIYNKLCDKHNVAKKPNFFERLFNMKAARVYNTQQKVLDSIKFGMNIRGISTESFKENASTTSSPFASNIEAEKAKELQQLDRNAGVLVSKQNQTLGIKENEPISLGENGMTQQQLTNQLNNTFSNIDKSLNEKTSEKSELDLSKNIGTKDLAQK